MKNRLIVDYRCALFATWCCKTLTITHAQNIVVKKFVRAEGDAAASPLDPPLSQAPVIGSRYRARHGPHTV